MSGADRQRVIIPSLFSRILFAVALLGVIYLGFRACREDPETSVLRLSRKGDAFYNQEKYQEALIAWREALGIKTDSADILKKISLAYASLADFSKAADALKQVLQLAPQAWEVWLDLAKLQLLSGDLAGALASWEKVNQRGGRDPAVNVLYGDIMILSRRFDRAEAAYQLALEIEPRYQPAMIKLATCYFALGKIDKAQETYLRVEALKPESTEILLQMAEHLWGVGDLQRAEKLFLRSASIKPGNLALQKKLVDFYFDTRQHQRCHDILDKIIEKTPGVVSFRKLKAEVLLKQNRTEEAGNLLHRLSQELFEDLEIQLLMGKYYLHTLQPSLAVNQFKALLDKKPNLPVVHFMLGVAYLGEGSTHLARGSFIPALAADPYFTEAELALAGVYYKTENYDLSLEHARRVNDREPESFRACMLLGNLHLVKREYGSALKMFSAASKIHPEAASPVYYMGLTQELGRNPQRALAIYRALLEKRPDLVDAAVHYSRLLVLAERRDEAIRFFSEAAEKTPNNGFILHILGELHLAGDNWNLAEKHFARAIAAEGKLASSYLKLAEVYHQHQDIDRQKKILQVCTTQAPEFIEAYTRLGSLYFEQGDMQKAIDLLEPAVARNPESPVLANNLAWLYLESGNELNRAFQLAQSAYEHYPGNPAIADTLGWAYYKKNIYEQAVWYLTEALEKDSDQPGVRFRLGMAYYQKKDMARARSEFMQALRMGKDFQGADEARRMVKQLEDS